MSKTRGRQVSQPVTQFFILGFDAEIHLLVRVVVNTRALGFQAVRGFRALVVCGPGLAVQFLRDLGFVGFRVLVQGFGSWHFWCLGFRLSVET